MNNQNNRHGRKGCFGNFEQCNNQSALSTSLSLNTTPTRRSVHSLQFTPTDPICFFLHCLAFSFPSIIHQSFCSVLILILILIDYGNECSSRHQPKFPACFPPSWVGLQVGEEPFDTFQRDQGLDSVVFVHWVLF